MAYYNGFPATYQPLYQQYPQVPQQTPAPNQQNGKIWVIGEAGAKSYLVAPNSTVDLWDSEAPVIYLKSADASGMPSMKILDYTVRETERITSTPRSASTEDNATAYATKEEIKAISDQITALRERVDGLSKRKVTENE